MSTKFYQNCCSIKLHVKLLNSVGMDGQGDINGHSPGGANTPKNQSKYLLPKYRVF
jgi:hypothetical protein